jgi:hypothetical protein
MAFLLAKPTPHNVNHDNDRFSMFNKKRDITGSTLTLYFTAGPNHEADGLFGALSP